MSDAIKAYVKARKAMGAVIKNTINPHLKSKYADLGSVLDACQGALHDNGFAVLQPCGKDDHGAYVETVLAHESGESFASRVYLVIGKQDMQGVGSAITYARRYGLLGMAGLAPEDDDGEATKARKGAAQAETTSDALRDAWRDGVEDSMPPNATPRQKAEAYAKAVAADFQTVKTLPTLDGRWDRHLKIIDSLRERFSDLADMVTDAYENRKMSIEEAKK